jgi:hypothetical protein
MASQANRGSKGSSKKQLRAPGGAGWAEDVTRNAKQRLGLGPRAQRAAADDREFSRDFSAILDF